jgi:uridine nucleosidase
MFYELLMFFATTYRDVFKLTEGPPLHDPLAVALILPTSIAIDDGVRFKLSVVLSGVEIGRTVAEKLPLGTPGVRIPNKVDNVKFWALIEDCLHRAELILASQ